MSSRYSTVGWNDSRHGHKAEHVAGGVRVHPDGPTVVLPDTAGFSWSSPGGTLFVPFAAVAKRYSPDVLDRLHRSLMAFEEADRTPGADIPFPPGVLRAAEMATPPMGAAMSVLPEPESRPDELAPEVDADTVPESVTETDSIARADLPPLDQHRESDI